MRKQEFRVLLVEDEPEWLIPLGEEYERILGKKHAVMITSVTRGQDALNKLKEHRDRPYDLLSLDINLGLRHPRGSDDRPNLRIEGADGRTVLRRASEWGSCGAIIVITGLHDDDTLHFVMGGEQEVRYARMTIGAYMQELFPGRHILYSKAGMAPNEFVSQWGLSYPDLARICLTPRHEVPPPYMIDFDGDELRGGRVIVRSATSSLHRLQKIVTKRDDQRFLIALAKWTPQIGYVPFEAVLGIFDGPKGHDLNAGDQQRTAHSRVNSVRRRLRPSIDPDNLFEPVPGKGWCLLPGVKVKGGTDANPIGGGRDPDTLATS
jgi:CheY-like chemotaxis protein